MNALIDKKAMERLEEMLLSMPQVEMPITHTLSGGMYARTMTIPAGTVVVGATHKKEHICVIIGDIEAPDDQGMRRITGHHVIAAKAGIKRAVYAHADTTWTTIVKTDLTDIEEIENECVVESDRLMSRNLLIKTDSPQELEGK